MTDYDRELDASGLTCPLPVLHVRKTLSKMAAGDVLRVIATDPGSIEDIPAFARQTGHELLDSGQEDDHYVYLLRKGNRIGAG